jgi:hypothetical protein
MVPCQHPVPARRDRDRLRESQDHNKENDGTCGSLAEHYISELMKDGFDRDFVVRALTITENNLDMAKSILREFVPRK